MFKNGNEFFAVFYSMLSLFVVVLIPSINTTLIY